MPNGTDDESAQTLVNSLHSPKVLRRVAEIGRGVLDDDGALARMEMGLPRIVVMRMMTGRTPKGESFTELEEPSSGAAVVASLEMEKSAALSASSRPWGVSCGLRKAAALTVVAIIATVAGALSLGDGGSATPSLSGVNMCPDGRTECPLGGTCCPGLDGGYGCAPAEANAPTRHGWPAGPATCCADKVHACAHGYTCGAGRCKNPNGSVPHPGLSADWPVPMGMQDWQPLWTLCRGPGAAAAPSPPPSPSTAPQEAALC